MYPIDLQPDLRENCRMPHPFMAEAHVMLRHGAHPAELIDRIAGLLAGEGEDDVLRDRYRFDVLEANEDGTTLTPRILGDLFAAGLDPAARKGRGAFYTPDTLAIGAMRAAVRAWQESRAPNRSETIRILDPAAGSGTFLIAAIQVLRDEGFRSLQVFGADTDADALRIAGLRLGFTSVTDVSLEAGDGLDPRRFEGLTFDLVVGNPPYGLVRADARVWGLDANRTDSYAAFLVMGLARLAPGGHLAFVTADTWLTIRRHRALRARLLPHLGCIALLPAETFRAAVNTCLVQLSAHGGPAFVRMADLSRSAASAVPEALIPALFGSSRSDALAGYYDVPTAAIQGTAGLPFFVGKASMADLVGYAGRTTALVPLGDVASVPHGFSTGCNKKYLRVLPGTPGGYGVLTAEMRMASDRMASLSQDERTRGVAGDWEDGRACFVPLDKGADSDAAEGWLPSYNVPTPYYINWAQGAIEDMRRNPGFAWKNSRYFFRPGLTFSVSGVYAPTFRISAGGIFEAKGSCIFSDVLDPEWLLGILSSRLARYIFKVFLKHSVDTSGDDIARFPLALPAPPYATPIRQLVRQVMTKQQVDPRYPFMRNEQITLDRLVADLYGLTQAERDEVDTWFARRYPRLTLGIGLTTR